MATTQISGITHYIQNTAPASAWRFLYVREGLVTTMRAEVGKRLHPPQRKTRRCVPDYLLADVAIEIGFDPEDVLALMSGRAYSWG